MRAWSWILGIAVAACAGVRAPSNGSSSSAALPSPAVPSGAPTAETAPAPTATAEPAATLAEVPQPASRFRIERDGGMVVIRQAASECPWLEYSPEWKGLRFRSDRIGCEPVTLSGQEALVAEMVAALKTDLGARWSFESFSGFGLGHYSEFYERLAIASLTAKRWDKRSGRPLAKSESINACVVALGQNPELFPEVVRIFEPLGYRVSLSSVEKVFVGKPEETPFAASLRSAGARPADKVPYDSMVSFKLEALAQ